MDVADAIAALPRFQLWLPFDELPLPEYTSETITIRGSWSRLQSREACPDTRTAALTSQHWE